MRRGTALVGGRSMLRPYALALILLGGLVALAIGVPWASNTGSASPDGSLTCSVKASCDGGEVEVFRMSSLSNAHAGTPSGSSYPNVVCCGDVTGLGISCSGNYDTVLALSDTDNAHVATTVGGAYSTEVCLSVTTGAMDCTHISTCPTGYACLATISGSTNAHVADCDGLDDYATKVCCAVPAPGDCPNPGDWPWPVPAGDADCDGYSTTDEGTIGTDPADPCPDDPTDDAWPSDFDMNKVINLGDLFNVLPPHFGSSPSIPDTNGDGIIDWSPRRDLVPDGFINLGDVFMVLPPYFGYMCT